MNFTRMAQTWAHLATNLEATKSLLDAFGPDLTTLRQKRG
jgi:hypothetical protein